MSPEGFLCEVFSSYQGEGGSVRGSCMGRRQVFVRFAGCNLASGEMGTEGCVFCDSPNARLKELKTARLETRPGRRQFREADNPLDAGAVLDCVRRLVTPDLHSVSLTGGEPLYQGEFLRALASGLRKDRFRTYLETNGSLPSTLSQVARLFDFACVDAKDRFAHAASDWGELLDREFECIGMLKAAGVATFCKMVVTDRTRLADVEHISRRLGELDCPLAIQVVTPRKGVRRPSRDLLFALTEAAAKHLQPDGVAISVQTHRLAGLL